MTIKDLNKLGRVLDILEDMRMAAMEVVDEIDNLLDGTDALETILGLDDPHMAELHDIMTASVINSAKLAMHSVVDQVDFLMESVEEKLLLEEEN